MQVQTLVDASDLTSLTNKIVKLARHAKDLNAVKTPAELQKTIETVFADMNEVRETVDGIAGVVEHHANDNTADESQPSTVKKPVEVVRKFLARNPNMSRKNAIEKLYAKGVNRATARTQYHKFHKEHRQ